MGIGPRARALFGRYERPVSEAFRGFFFDLDHLVEILLDESRPRRILEIGCGEGCLTERLGQAFPEAQILGIDISPRVGRLARVDPTRVEFRTEPAGSVAKARPRAFDLVVLCDVLHHVPAAHRDQLIREALDCLSPGGLLVLKDWERRPGIVHGIAYFCDRYITGDRIEYESASGWRSRLSRCLPGSDIREFRLRPRHNNLALLARA